MIKTFNELQLQGNNLSVIKGTVKKPISNNIFNGKTLNA